MTTFINACESGDLNLAKSLHFKGKPIMHWLFRVDLISINDVLDAFYGACKNGHLHVVQWIYSIYTTLILPERIDGSFAIACANGHFTVAQWMYTNLTVNIHANHEMGFQYACFNGHLHIAQWLWSLKENRPNLGLIFYDIFRQTCSLNQLIVAKWLYNKLNADHLFVYISNTDFANIFITACEQGHLEMAQWLHSLNNEFDIHHDDECAFRRACSRGHLEVAQWLYSLGVNIHIKHEWAFIWACMNNHLNIAQWMWSLHDKPNLDMEQNYIFKTLCVNAHKRKDILMWICTLCDKYTVILNDNGEIVNWYIDNTLKEKLIKENIPITHEICGICLEANSNRMTPCNHQYCADCIKKWHKTNQICPYCRQPFSSVVIF